MDLQLKPSESYSIVSDAGCTVSYTDAAGSVHTQLTVPAHKQTYFTCVSARTSVSDNTACVTALPNPDRLVRGMQREEVLELLGSPAEPEELGSETALQNGHVYELELEDEAVSLASLTVGAACTSAEIWITAGDEVPELTWPEAWEWVDNADKTVPTPPVAGSLNCYVVRRDSKGVIINLAYYH